MKYKSITVYIKNKTGRYLSHSIKRDSLNMFPKTKQNKLRQVKEGGMKEEN